MLLGCRLLCRCLLRHGLALLALLFGLRCLLLPGFLQLLLFAFVSLGFRPSCSFGRSLLLCFCLLAPCFLRGCFSLRNLTQMDLFGTLIEMS